MTYSDVGVFSCDECPESIDTGEKAFPDALAAAKAEGWRAFIGPDKAWAHACPDCVSQHAEQRR